MTRLRQSDILRMKGVTNVWLIGLDFFQIYDKISTVKYVFMKYPQYQMGRCLIDLYTN